jgi:hypothetical protein
MVATASVPSPIETGSGLFKEMRPPDRHRHVMPVHTNRSKWWEFLQGFAKWLKRVKTHVPVTFQLGAIFSVSSVLVVSQFQ